MKYSQVHESFITKYLFWNRIQEITKVFCHESRSYIVCILNNFVYVVKAHHVIIIKCDKFFAQELQ